MKMRARPRFAYILRKCSKQYFGQMLARSGPAPLSTLRFYPTGTRHAFFTLNFISNSEIYFASFVKDIYQNLDQRRIPLGEHRPIIVFEFPRVTPPGGARTRKPVSA